MIGAVKIVVDRLGNAHHAAFIADALHIFRNLVAGIHRIVAAVVEEITDVILAEDFQDPLIIGIVHIGILELIAAGTERGGRSMQKQGELVSVFFAHIVKNIVQNAADAVGRTVNLRDIRTVQRSTDYAVSACIDNRSRTAGLADDRGTNQLLHIENSNLCIFRIIFIR